MPNFGGTRPRQLGYAPSVPTFPSVGATYTSPDGAIVIPPGALDRWYAYRRTGGAVRRDVIVKGDSTSYGSGGLYSWVQRIRDRANSFGMIDGGKGMFAGGEGGSNPIQYDPPEINGWVSQTFVGSSDAYDNTEGQYFYDNGSAANRTVTLQFLQTGCRLWYSSRAAAGDFTYSIDGGAAITVQAYKSGNGVNKYVNITGLAANTTHTITITNLATSSNGGGASGTPCWIALAPINTTGVVFQKYATSGDTINNTFYRGIGAPPWTSPSDGNRAQSPLGLVPQDMTATTTPPYTGAVKDTTYSDINPVLSIWHLGFNDLTQSGTLGNNTDLPMWTEYVKLAAGMSYDAGCDCLILSGQLPYNQYWPTYGAARYNALKAQALASGVGFADIFYPVGGPSLSYSGGTTNPHLTKTQYQAQADFLWDNLLGLPI